MRVYREFEKRHYDIPIQINQLSSGIVVNGFEIGVLVYADSQERALLEFVEKVHFVRQDVLKRFEVRV